MDPLKLHASLKAMLHRNVLSNPKWCDPFPRSYSNHNLVGDETSKNVVFSMTGMGFMW